MLSLNTLSINLTRYLSALTIPEEENGAQTADTICAMSDGERDQAVPISLQWHAKLTIQYWIEARPLSHNYHHFANIHAIIDSFDRIDVLGKGPTSKLKNVKNKAKLIHIQSSITQT